MIRLETDRLILRGWQERDFIPFAAMNADRRVMEFFPSTLTRAQSRKNFERAKSNCTRNGFHFQPIEDRRSGAFGGFVGLARVPFDAPFTPAVEIGWRLPVAFWGKGYATEAAAAWLAYGFEALGLEEIVSFTVDGNRRSRAVMTRIGMTRDAAGDFLHPDLDPAHELARHVLYRLKREEF